jgi:hypothetical protein
MNAFRLAALVLVFAACGRPEPVCECSVPSFTGFQIIECGESACFNGAGYQCSAHGKPVTSVFACPPVTTVTTCTPKTCATANTACGPVADGCGGTLECGTCAGTDRCMSGQCQPSPCAQAGLVCGVLNGNTCGTCTGTSTCSIDQRQCIETVTTISAATGITSAALASNTLYLSVAGSTSSSIVEVDLASGTRRDVTTGERISPLAVNGSHLFYASSTGLHRVALGSVTVENLSGLNGSCYSLLADAQHVYCGVGGDPRLGVSYYGIDRLPVGGGVRTDVVSYLNYPSMAKVGNLLFHVGTTDNFSSFAVMGVTDLNDMSAQSLVSGGPLGSRFVLADAAAFYFLDGQTLTRAPFDNSPSKALAAVGWLRQETTIADGSSVVAVGEVNGVGGLYRLPIGGGAAVKLADEADFGGNSDDVTAILKSGDRWLVVTSSSVYRLK